jgi:hypothetical protein
MCTEKDNAPPPMEGEKQGGGRREEEGGVGSWFVAYLEHIVSLAPGGFIRKKQKTAA